MDGLNSLIEGFATALTPINLLYAFLGVLLGTAIGVLPGIGPAMTIALLLPLTYTLEPTQAFIMFAGIYYGGMYGGSTTSILLNTPGESASVITAIEGNLMAKKGRAAAALATAAIGSFIAGTIGTLGLALLAPGHRQARRADGRTRLLRRHGARLHRGHHRARARRRSAASPRSASACSSGSIGIDPTSGQQRLTLGIPELADGIDVVVVAVGSLRRRRGALGRRPPASLARRDRPRRRRPDEPRGLVALLEAVAARHGDRLPLRRHPRRWRRDPDLPLLRDGEEADQAPGGLRPAAPSRASPARRRRTTPRPPVASCRCSRSGIPTTATAAVMLGAFQSYGIQPGPRLLDDAARARLGPHRQPLHRQHDPAGAQPAARRRSGPSCCASPVPTSTPASSSSPASGRTPPTTRPSTCGCSSSSARSASSCAASACRSCRRSSASSSARSPRSRCVGRCRSATAS